MPIAAQPPVDIASPQEMSSDEEIRKIFDEVCSEDEAQAKELQAEKRATADDHTLTQHWKRTKTKGKGVELVEK